MIKTKWVETIKPEGFERKPFKKYGTPSREIMQSILEDFDGNKEAVAKYFGVSSWIIRKWLGLKYHSVTGIGRRSRKRY